MLYCMEIQQLIFNIDFWMTHITFHVQLLKMFYHHGGDHVAWGKTKKILHMAP